MFKLTSFEGFEYEKTPYQDLLDEIRSISGYNEYLLGNSYGGLDVYGFSLADLNKPVFYIHGNIHGAHEWRTVHWVKKFMEILINPLPSHSKIINQLKSR